MTRPRSTVAVMTLLLGLSACCGRSDPVYVFAHRWLGTGFSSLDWNGQTNIASGDTYYVRVLLPDHIVPSTELLEFYDADGARVIVPGIRSFEDPGDGCPQYFMQYDLELPDGLYSIVHRFSSAPGLTTVDADMATTFDGEAALVTRVLFGEPPLDGGRADAGPQLVVRRHRRSGPRRRCAKGGGLVHRIRRSFRITRAT